MTSPILTPEERGRLSIHNFIAQMGLNYDSTAAAVGAAKGALAGALDELVILTGPEKAYETAMKYADDIIRMQAKSVEMKPHE